MTRSFIFKTQTKKFVTTHVILFFKNQKIRLISPEISKTQVHKCTSTKGGRVIQSVYTRDVLLINTSTQD